MSDSDEYPSRGYGVKVSGTRLTREFFVRGWTAADVSRISGLSRPTVRNALKGNRVKPVTLIRLVQVLKAHEPVDGVEDFVVT
jgi:transcriptional regulator with XRE-family HTH domain